MTDLEDLWFIEENGKLGTIKKVLANGEYFVMHNGFTYRIVHVSKLADLQLMNLEQLTEYQRDRDITSMKKFEFKEQT